MRLETYIRKQARSSYWQEIYRAFKNGNGINLFENQTNFSSPQYLFLYWLRVYDILYEELARNESLYLDKDVINNDLRCDAFLYYRKKEQDKILAEQRRKSKQTKGKTRPEDMTSYPIYKGPKNKGD